MVEGKMKGRKKGHSLPSPFTLLFFCIAGHATAELDGSKEEHVVGAALPPLKLVHSFCAMKADDGPCKAIHIRYFFNIKSRKCEVFEYGGCHGNENNFLTLEECQEKCVVTGQYPFSYPPTNSSFASVISHSQITRIWEVEALFSSY
ncbi:hypothetical protein DUI87_04265 [Hirundo rustica rustica]|uniref:BPTI/Kunitz inhibitor domain-containing protein n=1 Tax=Hirundo rustica rustica TaxID=333673 RepID=A0A3M0KYK4_HIRRU|nr:hypothetical protein DUI87_04265 [Hirundo rustica rustica]